MGRTKGSVGLVGPKSGNQYSCGGKINRKKSLTRRK